MTKDPPSLFELLDSICPGNEQHQVLNQNSCKSITNSTGSRNACCMYNSARDGKEDELLHFLNPATINRRNPETGRTILHEAAANGHHRLIRQLINQGADVNIATFLGGDTALHLAATNGQIQAIADILNANDADPNIRNKFKATPLHYAKSIGIADLLISHGASLDLKDANNTTQLQAIMARPANESEQNEELIRHLTDLTEEQTRVEIRKELDANRERRRSAEEINTEQREREEAEHARQLNSKLISEYKRWRSGS